MLVNRTFRLACAVVVLFASSLWGQDGGGAATTQPSPETPLVTVGGKTITQGDVDTLLEGVPEFRRAEYMDQALTQLTARHLAGAYVKAGDLPVDEKEFAEAVENLRVQMALTRKYREAVSPENVKAYIAAHPHYFDGTKVTASHILIRSSVSDASADQLAGRAKLEGIAKEIRDGKITFAAAAKKHSEGPTSGKDGALGEIGFGGPMDPAFTNASFSTPKGQVSGVVRSGFGWHLILVTDIKPGDGKPVSWTDPTSNQQISPEQLAQRAIGATLDNGILLMAVKEAMVVDHRKKVPPKK